MTGFDVDYARDWRQLEILLRSVDRPGGFCTHGRQYVPMPTVKVAGVGTLSFPVPAEQVRALAAVAERAPYGKGTDTLVDTTVRDCRQIAADRIRVGGTPWPATLDGILDAVSTGLGCPAGRLKAKLYKLLIYDRGGFFAAHRDTEKVDGMIGTLSITLPGTGVGGELVVRHGDGESVVDMTAREPSELAYAAFYADCVHETRPVLNGHRLSLVFNLCLDPDDTETGRHPPDYSDCVVEIAERLAAWRDGEPGPGKLVWLLEHDYSAAGLSFATLKNADAAVGAVVREAAQRSDCEVHAAVVHIEEEGTLREEVEGWEWRHNDPENLAMDEVLDGRHWLNGWVAPDGDRPPFGEMSLNPGEVLPEGALDGAIPDEQWVNEATGNEGVTLERSYRHAALAIWPRRHTLELLAGEGIAGALAWVRRQVEREPQLGGERIARLIDLWPAAPARKNDTGRTGMLHLLARVGDASLAVRFLREVVLDRYDGSENEALSAVLERVGPTDAARFLAELAGVRFASRPGEFLRLVLRAGELDRFEWRGTLANSVRTALAALPAALRADPEPGEPPWPQKLRRNPMNENAIRDLFTLAWRCGLADEMDEAAAVVADSTEVVDPQRTAPRVVKALFREEGLPGTRAYLALWRHAGKALVERSARPPEEPSNWAIPAELGCDCEDCAHLAAFCRDPVARVGRFPLRKDRRKHLHRQIDGVVLDLFHVTERRGSPYTLVCTKNRASHKRRLTEYAEDIEWISSMIELAPVEQERETVAALLGRLRNALAATR